jgi:hypothetical protein
MKALVPYNTDLEGCPYIAYGSLTRAHVHQRLSANAHRRHLNIRFSVLPAYQNYSAIFGCQITGRHKPRCGEITAPCSRYRYARITRAWVPGGSDDWAG